MGEEEVAPIGHSNSTHVEKCIQKFNDWHGRKNPLGLCEDEQDRLAMSLSISDFLEMKKVLKIDEDEKFPRYCYDVSSATLTIQRMPSPIHEQVVSTVADGFSTLRKSLPTNYRRSIQIVTNQVFDEFDGRHDGTEKTPDTAVKITDAAGMPHVRFILEVGLSESYEMLVRDARTWLEGNNHVTLVMLVKLEENPPYVCPVKDLTDEEFEHLKFPDRKSINVKTFTLEGDYGPATYMGLAWVGEISGFLEVWERDKISGMAQITAAGRINLFDLLNTQSSLFTLRDFMELPVEGDHKVLINWDDYFSNLGINICELAAYRCRRMLKDRAGRADIRDADYEP
ncbi:hypothetical protein B9Z19DRAFT_970611 [Tuber borchii]|uniref:Uncharacterized protein n=1 Tax=Tuber borchii TaxID=42251 RepID=A0A2T7A214_TUBBO|nr:hypothetical protein B9Z19DRAFT_970611 [Tuber borchii]